MRYDFLKAHDNNFPDVVSAQPFELYTSRAISNDRDVLPYVNPVDHMTLLAWRDIFDYAVIIPIVFNNCDDISSTASVFDLSNGHAGAGASMSIQ